MSFGKGCHLHLIDGSAFIFRAYHALPPLTRKSDGLPVGAVSGFVNMLQRYIENNSGSDAAASVVLTDTAPEHTTYVDGSAKAVNGKVSESNGVVTAFLGTGATTKEIGRAHV